jgi:hypothetical protein
MKAKKEGMKEASPMLSTTSKKRFNRYPLIHEHANY